MLHTLLDPFLKREKKVYEITADDGTVYSIRAREGEGRIIGARFPRLGFNRINYIKFLLYDESTGKKIGRIHINPDTYEMFNLHIKKEYRGLNLGVLLDKYMLYAAYKMGIKEVWARSYEKTVNYHKKIGYKPVGKIGTWVRRVIMSAKTISKMPKIRIKAKPKEE